MQKNEKWYVQAKKADFAAIAEAFGIDQVTARLIRNRDVIGMEAVQEYLHGTLASLHDPEELKGCRKAALMLLGKIREGKKIRIIGDYDIDGVCAAYILYRALTECGAEVDYEIPDRMKDGYGLNISLVKMAVEEKVDTILTCDNGISAVEEAAYAREHGLTMIVTDHHEIPAVLPDADVIVNPHQQDCPYPFKGICGTTVAWKVICEMYRLLGKEPEEADQFLTFVGFATVGDVMELKGENRILVREGLNRLHRTTNVGLRALVAAAGIPLSEVTAHQIGFVIGPCINASGRLDTAKLSLRLLLAETKEEADGIAMQLKALNDERKSLTAQALDEAIRKTQENGSALKDRVLVVYLPDCHESIAGIVAGRLRERYNRPAFVLTQSAADPNVAKGSGRSIEAYSMYEEMAKCGDLFLKFGGHPMAAGFSLEVKRIPEMRRRLNENCSLTEEDLTEIVDIDVPMPIDYISEKVIAELSLLEPFGTGNPKPLFADRHLRVLSARIIGKNQNTVKMKLRGNNGCVMDALYFKGSDEFLQYLTGKYGEEEVRSLFWGHESHIDLDVTYYPSVNVYQGVKSLQIEIQNFR